MKLRLTLGFGLTLFLLGTPLNLSFPVDGLGHSLIVAGAILMGALGLSDRRSQAARVNSDMLCDHLEKTNLTCEIA